MKLFIDSANLSEIKEVKAQGLIDGVTTNPTLVAKEGREFKKLIYEICEVVDGPVSAEVVSTEEEGMIKEAGELVKIHKHVVVKIPMIPDGLKAIRRLSQEGIKINVTLIFSPTQALLAAKAGATYVSPFVGRLDDVSEIGMNLIEQIVTIFNNYDFKTQVLVASVRNPVHVVEAALMGADVATMPFAVLQQLSKHPLTDIGLKKFLADWEKMHQK
ncbi:MAG: fructose-6-phosphate aldolase [Nitrospira sp.]|nr:fructose-6-phosphate aldolase [Nitrospira sp.]